MMERQLGNTNDPIASFNLEVQIIIREWPLARNIPEPSPESPKYAMWVEDVDRMKQLRKDFDTEGIPVSRRPDMQPYEDEVGLGYNLKSGSGAPMSRFLADQALEGAKFTFDSDDRANHRRAKRKIEAWHMDIRDVLKRWRIWDERTEFSFTAPVFGTAQWARVKEQGGAIHEGVGPSALPAGSTDAEYIPPFRSRASADTDKENLGTD